MISFPANPQIGDLYSYSTRTWIWNGVAWQSAIYRPDGAIVSDVAPSGAKAGWSWWDRINSVLYVYDGSAWVESSQTFRTGDLDAWDYIYRVQSADGQDLEDSVIAAMLKFVIGCKTDGIWDAIKASCVMAGARTLNGALVPLKGTAPTNVGFIQADYNRKTGLKGDGVAKSLNSNRNNNADPQNSQHLSLFVTELNTLTSDFIGTWGGTSGASLLNKGTTYTTRSRNSTFVNHPNSNVTNFVGQSRDNSTDYSFRVGSITTQHTMTSQAPSNANITLYSIGNRWADIRVSFYSIGESINLSTLDSRVSTLMTDLNIAIP